MDINKKLIVVVIIAMTVLVPSAFAYYAAEGKIASSAPYSASELKSLSQILIKSGPPELKLPEPGNDGIDAIFKDVAPRIKTFDGEKYEKINAKLILEASGLVAPNIYNFDFLYNLEGMRDNRTEFWQLYIELMSDGNKVQINQITADWTLVPDKYVESGKEIALDRLDENIRLKTPVFADSKWLPESNSSIVLKFKDTRSSAITDVTLDLNEKRITNIEKRYWGETFRLNIIEAFDSPLSELGFSTSGSGPYIFLYMETDTTYGCYNFKIMANTTRSDDRIVVDIIGIDREGGYCESAMGPARYSEKLGDPRGAIDLILRYDGQEDGYILDVSDESIKITPQNTGFTHIEHPLSLLMMPRNVIWVDCGHYDRIGCEENSDHVSVCRKLFSDLKNLGAEPFELRNGTYAHEVFYMLNGGVIRNKSLFSYTGNISNLENIIIRYSAQTDRDIDDRKKCTLIEIYTMRGNWFYSWNDSYKDVQITSGITMDAENETDNEAKTSGFGLIAGLAALLLAKYGGKSGH